MWCNFSHFLLLLTILCGFADALKHEILPGECVRMDSFDKGLVSLNGVLALQLGSSGELEIWLFTASVHMKSGQSQSQKLIWRSSSGGLIFNYPAELCMQSDGNLVLYDSTKYAVWATDTTGRRNVVARLEENALRLISNNQVIWSSANSNG